jgi:hypothetical protein
LNEILQQLIGACFDCLTNLNKFHDIDPPFAAFVFGDKRLRPTKTFGEVTLRQAGGFARFNHKLAEGDLARILDLETTESEQDSSTASESNASAEPRHAEAPTGASERMRQALAEGKWAWRTVDTLAAKAAIGNEEALDLLRRDPEVELGRAKSGRTIARLRTRPA